MFGFFSTKARHWYYIDLDISNYSALDFIGDMFHWTEFKRDRKHLANGLVFCIGENIETDDTLRSRWPKYNLYIPRTLIDLDTSHENVEIKMRNNIECFCITLSGHTIWGKIVSNRCTVKEIKYKDDIQFYIDKSFGTKYYEYTDYKNYYSTEICYLENGQIHGGEYDGRNVGSLSSYNDGSDMNQLEQVELTEDERLILSIK